jgi:S-(hydroxymethyl)glutathione dehydrogenase/alcohol dehydrogenase
MPREIHAAVLSRPDRRFSVERLLLADPRPGEVLVKISACGVCHSDWHVATGDTKHPMPCVVGHEGAGIVEALGDGVSELAVGDSVVLSWAPDCGKCFYCRRGKANLCGEYVGPLWDGVMLDGEPRLSWNGKPVYHYCGLAAFAEYVVVPAVCCVKAPMEVKPEIACLVGCAVATGVGAVLYSAGVKQGESVAVFGCGGVGLSILQGAKIAGAEKIIAVDRSEAKRDLALRMGATDFVLANGETNSSIRRLTDGRGADWVFEAIGVPKVQEDALEAVRPGGGLVLVGLAPMGTATNFPSAKLAREEKRVIGSYYGGVQPRKDFPMLLDWVREGRLVLEPMISRTWKLNEINEAFAEMLKGDVGRGVVVFRC